MTTARVRTETCLRDLTMGTTDGSAWTGRAPVHRGHGWRGSVVDGLRAH